MKRVIAGEDKAIELASLIFLLLLTYYLKFIDIVSWNVTPIGWAIFSVYAILRVRLNVVLLSIGVFSFMFAFYALGVYFSRGNEDLDYFRVFLTFIFLFAISLGVLTGELKQFGGWVRLLICSKKIVYLFYVLIVYWVFFIWSESQVSGDYLVTDYGGKNYLTTSDLLALFTLTVVGSVNIKAIESIVFALLTLFALMLLGSRSSMILFLFCYALYFRGIGIRRGMLFAIIFFVFVFLFYLLVDASDSGLFYRVKLVFDLSGDDSRVARSEFFNGYIENIIVNPACFIMPCLPIEDNYAHNIFSFHQYFGLMVFSVIVVAILFMISFLVRSDEPIFLGLIVYCLLQVLFFRSWDSLVSPILLAYAVYTFPRFNFLR